jgi:flagellar biosynthetic protein FliQ
MQSIDVAAILHAGMIATLKLLAPMLLATLVAGLVIAVLQAVTQISDSTVSFLPKLIATGLAAWLAGPFMFHVLADYTHEMADRIVAVGGE